MASKYDSYSKKASEKCWQFTFEVDETFADSIGDLNYEVSICVIIRLPRQKDSDEKHLFVCKPLETGSETKNKSKLRADVPKIVLKEGKHIFVKFGVFKTTDKRKRILLETYEMKVTKREIELQNGYSFGTVTSDIPNSRDKSGSNRDEQKTETKLETDPTSTQENIQVLLLGKDGKSNPKLSSKRTIVDETHNLNELQKKAVAIENPATSNTPSKISRTMTRDKVSDQGLDNTDEQKTETKLETDPTSTDENIQVLLLGKDGKSNPKLSSNRTIVDETHNRNELQKKAVAIENPATSNTPSKISRTMTRDKVSDQGLDNTDEQKTETKLETDPTSTDENIQVLLLGKDGKSNPKLSSDRTVVDETHNLNELQKKAVAIENPATSNTPSKISRTMTRDKVSDQGLDNTDEQKTETKLETDPTSTQENIQLLLLGKDGKSNPKLSSDRTVVDETHNLNELQKKAVAIENPATSNTPSKISRTMTRDKVSDQGLDNTDEQKTETKLETDPTSTDENIQVLLLGKDGKSNPKLSSDRTVVDETHNRNELQKKAVAIENPATSNTPSKISRTMTRDKVSDQGLDNTDEQKTETKLETDPTSTQENIQLLLLGKDGKSNPKLSSDRTVVDETHNLNELQKKAVAIENPATSNTPSKISRTMTRDKVSDQGLDNTDEQKTETKLETDPTSTDENIQVLLLGKDGKSNPKLSSDRTVVDETHNRNELQKKAVAIENPATSNTPSKISRTMTRDKVSDQGLDNTDEQKTETKLETDPTSTDENIQVLLLGKDGKSNPKLSSDRTVVDETHNRNELQKKAVAIENPATSNTPSKISRTMTRDKVSDQGLDNTDEQKTETKLETDPTSTDENIQVLLLGKDGKSNPKLSSDRTVVDETHNRNELQKKAVAIENPATSNTPSKISRTMTRDKVSDQGLDNTDEQKTETKLETDPTSTDENIQVLLLGKDGKSNPKLSSDRTVVDETHNRNELQKKAVAIENPATSNTPSKISRTMTRDKVSDQGLDNTDEQKTESKLETDPTSTDENIQVLLLGKDGKSNPKLSSDRTVVDETHNRNELQKKAVAIENPATSNTPSKISRTMTRDKVSDQGLDNTDEQKTETKLETDPTSTDENIQVLLLGKDGKSNPKLSSDRTVVDETHNRNELQKKAVAIENPATSNTPSKISRTMTRDKVSDQGLDNTDEQKTETKLETDPTSTQENIQLLLLGKDGKSNPKLSSDRTVVDETHNLNELQKKAVAIENPATSNTPSKISRTMTRDKVSDQGLDNTDEQKTETKLETDPTSTDENIQVLLLGKDGKSNPKLSSDRTVVDETHNRNELQKKAVAIENPATSNTPSKISRTITRDKVSDQGLDNTDEQKTETKLETDPTSTDENIQVPVCVLNIATDVSCGSKTIDKESVSKLNDSANTSGALNKKPNAGKKSSNDGVISEDDEDVPNWSPQNKNIEKSRELIFSVDVKHLELFEDVIVGVALFLQHTNNYFVEVRYYLCEKMNSRSKSTNSYRVFLPKPRRKSNQFFIKVFMIQKNVELLPENFLKESEEIRMSAEELRLDSIDLGPIDLSTSKQSTEHGDATCAIDESIQEQEGLKTLKEMIKNESIDKYKPLKGKVIELNVIIGADVIDPKAASMTVVVSFPGSHQGFVEGYIACETEEHMWVKFHFRPRPNAKEMLYKYNLIKIMKKDHAPKTESETLKDSNVSFTRTLLLSDVAHTWFEGKFDGKIHFPGKTVTKETSAWNSVKNFFTGSTDTNNLKNQNWTAISIYLDLMFRIFLSTCETSALVKSIKNILSSLGQFRWTTGNNAAKEGKIDDIQLINMALAQTYTLFENCYENYIDGKPAKDTILFKLGVVLMVCYVDNIWPVIDAKNLIKVSELIALVDHCDRKEIASAVNLMGINLGHLCIGLREYCADMLTEKCCKLREHPLFMALIDWAYLDDSEYFLTKAHKFQISETFFETCKPHCKSFASVRHLLTFALSSGLQTQLRENWELSLADVLECMMQLHRNNISLSMTLLTLSRNIVEEDESLYQEHFYCLQKYLQFLPKYHSSQRFFINQMLHLSMDVLAGFESNFPHDQSSSEREAFYAVFYQIVEKINVIGRSSMMDDDIFYWANLLRIRDGYSQTTIQFVNSDLKQLFFVYVRTTSGFAVPQYCMELPNKVQQLRSTGGRDIPSYADLQLAFDEALINSLVELIDENSICENKSIQHLEKFILQVDKRPMVMEVFSRIVLEKFPVEINDLARVETAVKLMQFPLTTTILELVRRENEATISRFSGILPKMSTLFAQVARLLDKGELTPIQLEAISQERENFALICSKLNLVNGKDIQHLFQKGEDALRFINAKVKQTAKLLEFVRVIESFGVEVNVGTIADFMEHWQEQPINSLVDFALPSSSMSLRGSSIENEDAILVEKYLALIESEIFSRIAKKTLKTSLHKNEFTSFTLTDVLKTHLPQAEAKYIKQARIVVSGELSVSEAKTIFHNCLNSDSINEEMDFFAKFLPPTNNLRDVRRFNNDVALRKRQLAQLEQLTKNMEFNTCLKSILEMLQRGAAPNNFNSNSFPPLVRIYCFHQSVRSGVFYSIYSPFNVC